MGGGVYAANTFGATTGVLSVPFFLLPTYGANRSYYAAAAVNVLVGAAAIWLDGRSQKLSPEAGSGVRVSGQQEKFRRGIPARVLTAMALASGALVLALEDFWTRMLAQVHENSIYSFAIVLSVFLVGPAGGAAVARVFLKSRRNLPRCLPADDVVARGLSP